jgi:hypothetical protein
MSDDEDFLTPGHDQLQQEFADLYVTILNAMGGDVPAEIGYRIDRLFASIAGYEDQLVAMLREREG